MKIEAFAAHGAKQPLEPFAYDAQPLGPWDVEISITCCGVCHSDVHLVDDDWGLSTYPLVPGHEIVGTVKEVGPQVTHLSPGQRVGVGWQRSACLSCEFCLAGEENLCPQQEAVCMGHFGGFARALRTDSRFVFPLPAALPAEQAAPLLCGGITIYSPLRRYVAPRMKVGVIGLGGLGHLAVQFARAFGCDVTVFSTTEAKEEESRQLGAHRFVWTRQPGALEKAANSLHFLLNTVHVDLDWPLYLDLLRPNGILCTVGASGAPVSVPAFALLVGQKAITGSVIGGRHRIREMLEFAARHAVAARVETMPMREVNAALDKVRRNQARYRMVLKN